MGLTDLFKSKKTIRLEATIENLKRKYEAAAQSRRTKHWRTGSGDANSEIKYDLNWLRDRSSDLRRNNPYAHKAIELVSNNVVGKGVMTQISNDTDNKAKDLFKEWAYTTACDYDGRHDLTGLQKIIMDAIQERGECIVRKRFVDDKKFPIKYQVLESDFLRNDLIDEEQKNGNTLIQGIEFDENGQRVGYHLFTQHPGSRVRSTDLKSNLINSDEIYHLFRQERPGQVRGVPWLSPCMIRIKDLDGFEDAQLMRAKIASLFVAFVRDISNDSSIEGEEDLDDYGEKMIPGMIEHLASGKTIEFANPPSFDLYKEFVGSQLRGIAAGYGVTYESLANDLSETNFSSGRMGWIEMDRNVQSWRKHILINQFMKGVEDDFKLIARLNNVNTDKISMEHVSPRRELIDPEKELKAIKASVRDGFESRSGAIQSLGRDPEKVYQEIKEDNDKADELDLILDTDPRYNNNSGAKHPNDGESTDEKE
tara:strand:+ start:2909 stop:4351 length:1443 start_codon:yes stop_codon:yes gene_type:complete